MDRATIILVAEPDGDSLHWWAISDHLDPAVGARIAGIAYRALAGERIMPIRSDKAPAPLPRPRFKQQSPTAIWKANRGALQEAVSKSATTRGTQFIAVAVELGEVGGRYGLVGIPSVASSWSLTDTIARLEGFADLVDDLPDSDRDPLDWGGATAES